MVVEYFPDVVFSSSRAFHSAWLGKQDSVFLRIASTEGADRNIASFPQQMPRRLVALPTKASGAGGSFEAPKTSKDVAILDHGVLGLSTLSLLFDGYASDSAPIILGCVVSSIHDFDIDSGEELSDISDDFAGSRSLVGNVLIDRVPGAS